MKELFRPDIREVYEWYDLRILGGRGAWKKAQCPMPDHEDANPSASVNEDLGKWNCFSCDSRGDGLDIIQAREKDVVGVVAASRFAEKRFGSGDCDVRDEPRPSSGLLNRAGSREGRRNWTPTWGVR